MQLRNGVRSIIKNGGWLVGATWVETGLRFIYVLAITRFLGPDLYGAWSFGLAAGGFVVGLAAFGLEILVPIRIGEDRTRAAQFIANARVLRAALSAAGAMAILVYALAGEDPGPARAALLMGAPAVFARSLATLQRALFIGFEAADRYARLSTAMRLSEVALGLGVLALGGGLSGILLLHAVCWIVEAALGALMARNLAGADNARPTFGGVRTAARAGAQLALASGLVGWLQAGPIVMYRLGGGELYSLGQIGLALQLCLLMIASGHALLSAALPVFARSRAQHDARADQYAPGVAAIALIGGAAAAALAHFVGPPLTVFAFGPDYAVAGGLVAPAVIIAALSLAPAGYNQQFAVSQRYRPAILANGAGAGLFTLFAPPAIGAFGAQGVFYAAIAGYLLRALTFFSLSAFFRETDAVRPA